MPRRDWTIARLKVDEQEGGRCRVCRTNHRVEAAHIIGREADRYVDGEPQSQPWVVLPTRIVPLCGPATDPTTCHGKYDLHRLNLIGYLAPEEEARAVLDAGGLEQARVRIAPLAYNAKKVAA